MTERLLMVDVSSAVPCRAVRSKAVVIVVGVAMR